MRHPHRHTVLRRTRRLLRHSLGAVLALSLLTALQSSPRVALGRDLAGELPMRYFHQYLGNASDPHDCGPTSVAMVLDAYNLRPAGLSDARFVASIRRSMGLPTNIGTIYDDLERAFSAYGLRYALVPSSLPGEPDAEVQLMRAGKRVQVVDVRAILTGSTTIQDPVLEPGDTVFVPESRF